MRHICGAATPRADRLQVLNAILGTPRRWLVDRFSDAELARVEDEAVSLGAELEAEGRCTDCGHRLPVAIRPADRLAREVRELWGA